MTSVGVLSTPGRPPSEVERPAAGRRETTWALLLAALGVLPRLAFVLAYPTRPISDFRTLVSMAVEMRHRGFAAPMWHWTYVNAGLPTFLSLLLAVAPGSPDTVARTATAILTGLVPLLPFFLFRGVESLRFRVVTAALLALWPGQILFSGVVAQDNWVVFPVVAAVALAIRSLRRGRAYPVPAALLYVLAVFIRQEMLIAMLPAAIVAAAGPRSSRPAARVLTFTAVTVILLGVIACQRGMATGRFRLTTEHGAQSLLGSYAPGARLGWIDPAPYVATFHRSAAWILVHEVEARPVFHLVRRTAALLEDWLRPDGNDLWWSLQNPEVQERPERARRLAEGAGPFLAREIFFVHAAFVASLILARGSARRVVALIAAVILLKVGIHLVIVSQGRFFVPVVALELLAIPFGCSSAIRLPRNAVLAGIAAGVAIVGVLGLVSGSAAAWTLDHEEIAQRTYRFILRGPGRTGADLRCVVNEGWVSSVSRDEARLELLRRTPAAGAAARCRCEIRGTYRPGTLALAIEDGFAPGGLPGGVVQRVIVDDRVVLVHDLAAEPGTGWQQVSLADGTTPAHRVTVEIVAVGPRKGIAWGDAAGTRIRLVDLGAAADSAR